MTTDSVAAVDRGPVMPGSEPGFDEGAGAGGFKIDFRALWLILRRNLWLIGGIALGLVGGVAAVILMEIVHPRVRSAAGVARATEVDVITELVPVPARQAKFFKQQEAA